MGVFGVGDGLRVTLYPPAAQGGCCGRSCSGRRCMRMALPAKNPAPPRSPPSQTAVHDEQDGGIRHGPDRSALKGLDTHRQLIALANMAACIISSATSALITTFCAQAGVERSVGWGRGGMQCCCLGGGRAINWLKLWRFCGTPSGLWMELG